MKRSLFDELMNMNSPVNLEMRAENAFHVSVKFLRFVQEQVDDPEDRKKLMSAWVRAVRDNDFNKFKRALNRYEKTRG